MIFINRRRMLNNKIIKDPSKYWYIEKYVYGKLVETVEVALGTGTTFGSIDSGFWDDTFYGWSINSTSTSRTFNATTTYKNTVTNVKNNLDAENTLKIYAIYSYQDATGSSSSAKVTVDNSNATIVVSKNSTAVFGGNYVHISGTASQSGNNVSSSPSSLSLSGYAMINGIRVDGEVNDNTGITKSVGVNEGDKILLMGRTINNDTTSGSTTYINRYVYSVNCTVPHYTTKTVHRVERIIGSEGITKPPIG